MAYVISDDCVMCGACESGCPVGAISEGDGKYEINADLCCDCGACAGVCPVGAPQEAAEVFSLHCFSADGASKEADHYKS